MKKTLTFFLLLLLVIDFHLNAQSLKVITYNLRYDNASDGENAWKMRKDKVAELFNFYDADIFGVQEGLIGQLIYLDSCLPKYQHIGIGRDDGKTQGEFSAIFFIKERFELIKTSSFWLSETPDTVSRGWDAVCNRICTYALLNDKKNNLKFWVFNTHFDHIGEIAQKNSAKLIIKKIAELNKENLPLILIGDFNMTPDKEPIKYISKIIKDTKHIYKGNFTEDEGTFNAFDFTKPVTSRIDYIFVDGFKVEKYRILTDSYRCKYLSDHLPVYVELKK
jgi:endonuclease/exonuclease/phosphatase family metal-dependent hydrolase